MGVKIKSMRKYLIAIPLVLTLFSCTKQPQPTTLQPEVSASDIESLKNEIAELRTIVESLTSTSIEVDGLQFDKNGSIITTPKLESVTTEKKTVAGLSVTLTTTRTLDDKGRLIKMRSQYSDVASQYQQALPFLWKELTYEYSGKKCKTTTHTSKYGLPAGVRYEEEVTEVTYW